MNGKKDLQKELFELTVGMDVQDIYSQLTFYLASLAGSKECPWTSGHQMAMIIGMLSDSYLGLYMDQHVKERSEENE